MNENSNRAEQNPHFPSGPWEGFYLYSSGGGAQRHPMQFQLNFQDGEITGSGSDDIGPLIWKGRYEIKTLSVTMVKHYASHNVNYQGMADTNGIYGTWHLSFMSGGFHIWPKNQKEEETEVEVVEAVNELVA